jgi:hypothetical protein
LLKESNSTSNFIILFQDEFATVVALDDGVVAYITSSIGSILGFPEDMLMGRSFIDFIHPKDRMAFASHITCGMNFPIGDQMHNLQGKISIKNLFSNASSNATDRSHSRDRNNHFTYYPYPYYPFDMYTGPFYCRMRQYRGLKTVGFGVMDKTIVYFPFKLTMQLKKVEKPVIPKGFDTKSTLTSLSSNATELASMRQDNSSCEGLNESASSTSKNVLDSPLMIGGQSTVYLVIHATRIKSAYQCKSFLQ